MKQFMIFGFFLIGITVFGQEFQFDIHNTSLKEYITLEKKLGGKKIPTTSNHISFNGDAQPLKFKRKQKTIHDLVSYYFFKKKDSTMSYILHEWDEKSPGLNVKENNKKSKKFQKALIAKFNQLEQLITNIYGTPKTIGSLSNIEQAEKRGGLKKKVIWTPTPNTEITMYTVISNYYEKKGIITINPTHRIRLYIKSTKK